jgi:hypothetical protein
MNPEMALLVSGERVVKSSAMRSFIYFEKERHALNPDYEAIRLLVRLENYINNKEIEKWESRSS